MSLPFWTFEQYQKYKIMGTSENELKALLYYKLAVSLWGPEVEC